MNLSANTQTLKSLSINNGGERVEDSTRSISYTIGQTNVGTLNNNEFIRMGFQQPSFSVTVVDVLIPLHSITTHLQHLMTAHVCQ